MREGEGGRERERQRECERERESEGERDTESERERERVGKDSTLPPMPFSKLVGNCMLWGASATSYFLFGWMAPGKTTDTHAKV